MTEQGAATDDLEGMSEHHSGDSDDSSFYFLDRWGPSHVLQVYDARIGLQGILVIDNTILGPGLGGVAISSTVSCKYVFERARTRTWTCALMDVAFGGAAACIMGKPGTAKKNQLIRSFARKVGCYVPWQFIATQDANVGKSDMATFAEEVGDWQAATGKPEYMQGIPHETGIVSFGIGVAVEACLEATDSWMSFPGGIDGAKVAILGYGATGSSLAKYLARKGASIIAICDADCAIHNPRGIDIESIPRASSSTGRRHQLGRCENASLLPVNDLTRVECDVFICTEMHPLLEKDIIRRTKARCVVEGSYGLLGQSTNQYLHRNGVLVLPSALAAAGGVISASAEYQHIGMERAFSMVEARIGETTNRMIAEAHDQDVPIQELIERAAQDRLATSMEGQA